MVSGLHKRSRVTLNIVADRRLSNPTLNILYLRGTILLLTYVKKYYDGYIYYTCVDIIVNYIF